MSSDPSRDQLLAEVALLRGKLRAAEETGAQDTRALRASETRLLRLVEQLPAGAVYVEGRRLLLNRAAEAITGYTRDELHSLDAWMKKLHPGRSEAVRELFARERLSGARRPVTVPITRPGGSERLLEITTYLEGENELWLLRDVTESARLARLMAQAERGAHIGGFELDWRSAALHWTEEVYRLHGVRPEDFSPTLKGMLGFYPGEAGQQLEEALRRSQTEGRGFELELPLVAARQLPRFVRVIGQAEHEGGRAGRVYGSIQDVTEKKRAADALREGEERWSFALEGSGDAVWDESVETGRIFRSRRWKQLLGYADEEIGEGREEWALRLHPEDRAAVLAAEQRHYRGESPVYVAEYRLRCKDGRYRWVLDRGKVLARSPSGRPLRVVGTLSDIHERKLAEHEVRRLTVELEERVAARTAALEAANAALSGAHERQQALLEALPDVMLRIRRDGTLVDFSAAPGACLQPSERLRGAHLRQARLPPDMVERLLATVQRVLASARPETVRFELGGPADDGPRGFEARFVPNGPEEVVAIVRDMTPRRAEAALPAR